MRDVKLGQDSAQGVKSIHSLLVSRRGACVVNCLVLLLCLFLTSCTREYSRGDKVYKRTNWWPIYHKLESSDGTERQTEILWPIIATNENEEEKEFYLRPFVSVKKGKKDDSTRVEYLWPLGKREKTPDREYSRFFPTTFKERKKQLEGFERHYVWHPPFYFEGQPSPESKYFAVFPFYGHSEKMFGKDEISFVMWPFYTLIRNGEARTANIFWPFFSVTRGGGRKGFKIWPIYGKSVLKDKYRKSFFLWPIFHRVDADLGDGKKARAFMVLPFYAYREEPGLREKAVMWPFIRTVENERDGYVTKYFPWPFLSKTTGENREGREIWPFWRYNRVGNKESTNVMWPIYWSDADEAEGDERSSWRIVPFFRTRQSTIPATGEKLRKTQLWPFFSYHTRTDGWKHFSMWSPLLVYDTGAFQRNYGPFWTIYEAEKNPDGTGSSKFLWRVVRREKTEDSESFEIIHLYSSERIDGERVKLSLLGGFWEVDKTGEKKKGRIFFIPFGQRKEEKQETVEE